VDSDRDSISVTATFFCIDTTDASSRIAYSHCASFEWNSELDEIVAQSLSSSPKSQILTAQVLNWNVPRHISIAASVELHLHLIAPYFEIF
jgi:hypothetical protein